MLSLDQALIADRIACHAHVMFLPLLTHPHAESTGYRSHVLWWRVQTSVSGPWTSVCYVVLIKHVQQHISQTRTHDMHLFCGI